MTIDDADVVRLRNALLFEVPAVPANLNNKVVCGDAFAVLQELPAAHFDLLFADPPYNLSKTFGSEKFIKTSHEEYEAWLDSWLSLSAPLLKPTASIYICGDWRSSAAIQRVGFEIFHASQPHHVGTRKRPRGESQLEKLRPRISGSLQFRTNSRSISIRSKTGRSVLAPYTKDGEPKDWNETGERKFSRHAPFEYLDRYQRAVLVDAREHRPPDPETGKTAGKDHSRKH